MPRVFSPFPRVPIRKPSVVLLVDERGAIVSAKTEDGAKIDLIEAEIHAGEVQTAWIKVYAKIEPTEKDGPPEGPENESVSTL